MKNARKLTGKILTGCCFFMGGTCTSAAVIDTMYGVFASPDWWIPTVMYLLAAWMTGTGILMSKVTRRL